MKKRNMIKLLIGVMCIVILLLVAVTALILDSRSPEPILGIFQTKPTISAEQTDNTTNPTEITVDTPTENDPTKATTTDATEESTTGSTTESTENGTTTPAETTAPPPESTSAADDPAENETTTPAESTSAAEDPTENQSTKPTDAPVTPTESTPPAEDPTEPSEEPVLPPESLPPVVDIPTEDDPEEGSVGVSFPCRIEEYGLVLEKMAPYNGMFVEDGSNVNVQGVAMLLVRNEGTYPLEYTQISIVYGEETLLFDISALPVGEKMVVQEKTGKSIPAGTAVSATAMVVQRAEMGMSEGKIRVTDNGDNTLTIQNLTEQTIPTVRVFYKYYMESEDVFVGGISFTIRITKLAAGASVIVQPSHYTSKTSRVVMVATYDSEV